MFGLISSLNDYVNRSYYYPQDVPFTEAAQIVGLMHMMSGMQTFNKQVESPPRYSLLRCRRWL